MRIEDQTRSTEAEIKVQMFRLGGKTGIESKSSGGRPSMDAVVKSLEEHLKNSQALRDRNKPEWLKEWEARQKGENADEDEDSDSDS